MTTPEEPAVDEAVAEAPEAVERVDAAQNLSAMLETVKQSDLAAVPAAAAPAADLREQTMAALRTLDQIPALQSLARNFAHTIGREEATIEEVVEVVERDPALCVRILRMANSVEVSPEQRIEDIDTAVQMLGLVRVRKTAQALFTLRGANSVAPGFDWRHLWIHGLATAAIAEEVERQLGLPANPHLHLAGLLHDVGKIVLSTIAPESYRGVLIGSWEEQGRLCELEAARFGLGHGEAGVIFARHCGLGDTVVAAIEHHDRPAEAGDHALAAAVVSVANFLSKAYGLGFSGSRLNPGEEELAALPAWAVLRAQVPGLPDADDFELQLKGFLRGLKAELASLRDEA